MQVRHTGASLPLCRHPFRDRLHRMPWVLASRSELGLIGSSLQQLGQTLFDCGMKKYKNGTRSASNLATGALKFTTG